MKKTRFAEEQMVKILREADKAPVAEATKKRGISDQTIYGCRRRCNEVRPYSSLGNLTPAEFKRAGSTTRPVEAICQV